MKWFSSAGTPVVRWRLETAQVDVEKNINVAIHLSQELEEEQGDASVLDIPVMLGFPGYQIHATKDAFRQYSKDPNYGNSLLVRLDEPQKTINLTLSADDNAVIYNGHETRPVVLSINRAFCAPIITQEDSSSASSHATQDLMYLVTHDTDPFTIYDSCLQLICNRLLLPDSTLDISGAIDLIAIFRQLMLRNDLSDDFKAMCLQLPSFQELSHRISSKISPPVLIERIERLRGEFGEQLREIWQDILQNINKNNGNKSDIWQYSHHEISARSLRHLAMSYLYQSSDDAAQLLQYYKHAQCLSERLYALNLLSKHETPQRQQALGDLLERAKTQDGYDNLLIDYWFAQHARASLEKRVAIIYELMQHEAFSLRNPNRVRALIGTFVNQNPLYFHASDGSGYRLLSDIILRLDKINSQIAARLCGCFRDMRRFSSPYADKQRQAVEAILAEDTSNAVYEIASQLVAQ